MVLHGAPEAAVGGPLAIVSDGDVISLDIDERTLHLDVPAAEIASRLAAWTPPEPAMRGGYQSLYVERVMQANTGADLDFLVGCRGHEVPRESH